MRTLRVYVDTSVIGAIFDDEFKKATITFFEQAREGRFSIVVSALVEAEILSAPQEVCDFYDQLIDTIEIVASSGEATLLRDAYLHAGVITSRWIEDALHVATATTTECDMIVSWNFRHIVHYDKRRRYNAVNVLHGYKNIDILTPAEVIQYEEEL